MSKSKSTASAKTKATAAKKPAAAKVTATKKTAAKPVAATKTPAQKAAPKKPVAAKSPVTKKNSARTVPSPAATLVAEIDVGFGNQLFIRGNGEGLSWDKGVLMTCVGDDRWEWSSNGITSPISCKVVLNDTIWSEGEDLTLAPGETKVIRPVF